MYKQVHGSLSIEKLILKKNLFTGSISNKNTILIEARNWQ
jgi:hypothetical protein